MKNILFFTVVLCMALSLFSVSVSAVAPTDYKTVYSGIIYNFSGTTDSGNIYYRFVPKTTDSYTLKVSAPSNYM